MRLRPHVLRTSDGDLKSYKKSIHVYEICQKYLFPFQYDLAREG